MQIVHTTDALRQALAGRGRPGFVPTMGNLHEGTFPWCAMRKHLQT